MACPVLETTKNTVIARPTCVKERLNSAISHGNSGGIMKWKKCEVPCANPTSEITFASWRRLLAGVTAADMGRDATLRPESGILMEHRAKGSVPSR